jgi:hypothetical protein
MVNLVIALMIVVVGGYAIADGLAGSLRVEDRLEQLRERERARAQGVDPGPELCDPSPIDGRPAAF